MDITPQIPAGRQLFTAYGEGRLRISGGSVWEQPVLVFPQRVEAWQPADIRNLTADDFAPLLAASETIEILLIGCGPRMVLIPSAVRAALREKGIVCDAMDTGGACRTFNVLVAEDRRVAAAVIPV